jgi:hypothetical protein
MEFADFQSCEFTVEGRMAVFSFVLNPSPVRILVPESANA